jgi:D-arabinonate dehydratase/D-galactarolactone cycloisomerase
LGEKVKITDVEAISLVVHRPEKAVQKADTPVSMPYAHEVKEVVFGRYQTTIVKVYTDVGVTGIGECISRLAPTATRDIVEAIKPVLIGRDPRDVDTIWEMLYGIMMNRGHTKGFYIEAISGIDIALWDAVAKHAEVPLYKLLGGLHNDPLECYASSIFFRGLENSVKEAQDYVEAGYGAIKIKIGKDPLQDVELVQAIRDAVGPAIRLMVDANCGYDVPTAVRVGKKLEEADIYWFEEPITPDNLDGYRRLSSTLNIPIAAGETEFTRYGFRDLITRGGIGIVQPNVSRTGGVTECKKIAAIASAHHVPYAPHTGSSSLVCLAASLQISAYLPGFLIYEYMRADWDVDWENPLRTRLAQEPFEEFEDGYLAVPQKPGIGMELNEETVQEYRV